MRWEASGRLRPLVDSSFEKAIIQYYFKATHSIVLGQNSIQNSFPSQLQLEVLKLQDISIKLSFSYDAHERRLKATIDWGDLPVNWSPKAFRWEFDFVFTPNFVELESGTERHFSKDGKMIKEYFYPDQPYMRLGKAFNLIQLIFILAMTCNTASFDKREKAMKMLSG